MQKITVHIKLLSRRDVLPWMKDMGLKKEDSKLIFYGMQPIMNEILHDPITMEEVEEADKFFKLPKTAAIQME